MMKKNIHKDFFKHVMTRKGPRAYNNAPTMGKILKGRKINWIKRKDQVC